MLNKQNKTIMWLSVKTNHSAVRYFLKVMTRAGGDVAVSMQAHISCGEGKGRIDWCGIVGMLMGSTYVWTVMVGSDREVMRERVNATHTTPL